MRTDRELLELAAKAAGLKLRGLDGPYGWLCSAEGKNWNPLTDDGDALRLAVALRLDLTFYNGFQEVHSDSSRSDGLTPSVQPYGEDVGAATRRAIVDAAAALGAQL